MAKNLVLNRTRKVPAEDTAAFGAIAERFRRAGALERAVELCREGLQKFPDHISARVTLGWSLLDLGKYDEARVELEQVLRRAPDNLAAIRGLAELHDRFEHTLHLPMDGPGQWPPPPESMDEAAGGGDVSAPDQNAADTDLEMSPAALGIPIWSASVGPVTPEPELETPPARTASVQASAPAPATAAAAQPVAASAMAAAPAQVSAPAAAPPPPVAPPAVVAAQVPAPPAAAAVAPAPAPVAPAAHAASEPVKAEAATPGSGMSSVREIDFANAPSVSVPAAAMEQPPVAVESREERAETTGPAAADAYAVSDADIQALLAEAESLDAAIAVPEAEETVSLDAMALGTEDPLSSLVEAEPAAPAVSYTSVTAPISVDLDLDTPPYGIAIPQVAGGGETAEAAADVAPLEMSEVEAAVETAVEVAAPTSEAAFELTAPAAEAALDADELFEAALEVAAPILDDALEIHQPELVEVEEPVVAAQAEPEAAPEPEVHIAAAIDVSPALESAPEIDVVSEIEVAPAIEAVAAAAVAELANVAAVAEVVSIELGRTTAKSPLPALERLLTKVQARRAQLMAESVA